MKLKKRNRVARQSDEKHHVTIEEPQTSQLIEILICACPSPVLQRLLEASLAWQKTLRSFPDLILPGFFKSVSKCNSKKMLREQVLRKPPGAWCVRLVFLPFLKPPQSHLHAPCSMYDVHFTTCGRMYTPQRCPAQVPLQHAQPLPQHLRPRSCAPLWPPGAMCQAAGAAQPGRTET